MGVTRYTGPLHSTKGFRFYPALYGDRPMTIVCTSVIRSRADSLGFATITTAMMGGLNKVTAAWCNLRLGASATSIATIQIINARPFNAANSVAIDSWQNTGVGQKPTLRAATLDVFILGYCT